MSDKPHRASHNIGRYLASTATPCFGESSAQGNSRQALLSTLDAAQAAALEQTGSASILSMSFALRIRAPIVDDVIRLKIPYLWLQDESSTTKPSPAPAQPASNASRTTAFFANTPNGSFASRPVN